MLQDCRHAFAARIGYRVLAWVLVTCVAIQVFLAGMAVFAGPENWGTHRAFVHLFELLPLIMLVLAFVGRLPLRLWWLTLGTWLLIFLQYLFIGLAGGLGIPAIGALHPVNALLIFWIALTLARGSGAKQLRLATGR
jgi:mercuric ion transport protein